MNQHQRKFLLEEIEKQYRKERDDLTKRRPVEPSLNNYLTAAILDGSAEMKSQKEIQEAIRRRVRDLGKGNSLVTYKGSGWNRQQETGSENVIELPALVLFNIPKAFEEVLEEYKKAWAEWETEMKALDSSIAAMRIKVQVGSDKALDALVEQADAICSMSLSSSSKLLSPSKETLQLGNHS